MNETEDKLQAIDAEVGAAYRELAQESPPAAMDAVILKASRQVVETGSGRAFLNAWLRPLTYVATAVVALTLYSQMSNTPDLDLPGNIDPTVAPLPADAFQDAAERTAEQIRQLEQDSGVSTSPPTSMAPAAATEPGPALSRLPSSNQCDDQARASSGTWWQCVRELELRGLPEAAERELQALLQAYPQFSAPQ